MAPRLMSRHRSGIGVALLAAAIVGLWIPLNPGGARSHAQSKPASEWTRFVATAARCGPGSRPESGLQGQMTAAERFGAKASQAYHCNLELVGQFEGEGAYNAMATVGTCAYFSTVGSAAQRHRGVVVADASDPRRPQAAAYLDSRAMVRPNESLDAHADRNLVGAVECPPAIPCTTSSRTPMPSPSSDGRGARDSSFDLYEAVDCRRPILKSSLPLPEMLGHAGRFAPDGRTYYATSWDTGPSDLNGIVAIDVTDPTRPSVILRWRAPKEVPPHDIAIGADGTRAYVSLGGNPLRLPGSTYGHVANGLAILDISDIQRRRPAPQVRVLGTLLWEDGGIAQAPVPLTIKGRLYIMASDWTGPGGGQATRVACAQGLPPFGFVRIIDISDEPHPKLVSKIVLQVHDPANCTQVLADLLPQTDYSAYPCLPDSPQDARLVACGFKESGLRVFDVRDPSRASEIGYYKPPARRTESRPGSRLFETFKGADRTADSVAVTRRFDRERGEIWFLSQDNAFQIVRFTDHFRAARPDLFPTR